VYKMYHNNLLYISDWPIGLDNLSVIDLSMPIIQLPDGENNHFLSALIDGFTLAPTFSPTLYLDIRTLTEFVSKPICMEQFAMLTRVSKVPTLTMALQTRNSEHLISIVRHIQNHSNLQSLNLLIDQTVYQDRKHAEDLLNALDASISQIPDLKDLRLSVKCNYIHMNLASGDGILQKENEFLLKTLQTCKLRSIELNLRHSTLYIYQQMIVTFFSQVSQVKSLEIVKFEASLRDEPTLILKRFIDGQLARLPKLREANM